MVKITLAAFDLVSQEYEKENISPTGSQLIKRKRDSGSTSTERQ